MVTGYYQKQQVSQCKTTYFEDLGGGNKGHKRQYFEELGGPKRGHKAAKRRQKSQATRFRSISKAPCAPKTVKDGEAQGLRKKKRVKEAMGGN